MTFNLRKEKLIKYDRKPSSAGVAYKSEYLNTKNKIKLFINDLNSIEKQICHGEFYAFTILYNNLVPKSSRYKFRKTIISENDIPQRDAKVVTIGNEIFLSVVYKLTSLECENFKTTLNELFWTIPECLNSDDWNKLNDAFKTQISQFNKIKEIRNTSPSNSEIIGIAFINFTIFMMTLYQKCVILVLIFR